MLDGRNLFMIEFTQEHETGPVNYDRCYDAEGQTSDMSSISATCQGVDAGCRQAHGRRSNGRIA